MRYHGVLELDRSYYALSQFLATIDKANHAANPPSNSQSTSLTPDEHP